MAEPLHIYAIGIPAPQGSKKAFVVKGRAVIVDDNPDALKSWRTAVATAARNAMGTHPLLAGPVMVSVGFYIPRPAYHYRTGKYADLLRPGMPVYCDKKPDVDKLLRAILDALTGTVYTDDSQVVGLGETVKVYADAVAGALVTVQAMP